MTVVNLKVAKRATQPSWVCSLKNGVKNFTFAFKRIQIESKVKEGKIAEGDRRDKGNLSLGKKKRYKTRNIF